MSEQTELLEAKNVVENELHAGEFVHSQKNIIFAKLEEYYKRVREQKEPHVMFLAQSLPLINGIVQVGSTLTSFRQASARVKEFLPNGDPVPILSTLTLIYTVEKGWEEVMRTGDTKKRALWTDMRNAVHALAHFRSNSAH